jgi:hypothetical protein
MDKQAFFDSLTLTSDEVRRARGDQAQARRSAAFISRAERAWVEQTNPELAAAQRVEREFTDALCNVGKYWASNDGSKKRIYFNSISARDSHGRQIGWSLADGYYDMISKSWHVVSGNLSVEQFSAACIQSGKVAR